MFDNPNDPQPTDPPTNTGGGTSTDADEIESGDSKATDPPTNTGGGGST